MDATQLWVDVRILVSVVITVGGIILYILTRFFAIESKLSEHRLENESIAGENEKEHEAIRQRLAGMEKALDGYKNILVKIDRQAEIQTDLLVKIGEITSHIETVKIKQAEMIEDLSDMKKKLDEIAFDHRLKQEEARRGRG